MQYTESAARVLAHAADAAGSYRMNRIGTEHLLAGLLEEEAGTASVLLGDANVNRERLHALIARLVAPQSERPMGERPAEYSVRAQKALANAEQFAHRTKSTKIGTEHLLLALIRDPECVAAKLLHTMGIDLGKLSNDTADVLGYPDLFEAENEEPGAQKSATPLLDQYSRDLTALAAEGRLDPVIGRQTEMTRLMQILGRRMKNNPCLIGEPGVGKTAIVEGLAARIAAGSVPEEMREKRIVTLDIAGMVAGTKYRGEFEERIRTIVEEVSRNKDIILFIDEIHTIIGAGGAEGALDAANILKPSLSRGEIRVIGATTIDEYRKHIEKDAALERRFQSVMVEEPTTEEAEEILKGLRPELEAHHRLTISDEAVHVAVTLSERYLSDRRLPDKAIDLLDEAAAKKRLGTFALTGKSEGDELRELLDKKERAILSGDFFMAKNLQLVQETVERQMAERAAEAADPAKADILNKEDIAAVVSESTRIPVSDLTESETKRLAKLEDTLHKRIIGQDEAVKAVAGAVKRGRVGLKDPRRPVGSFLFLGPTGVGKTELSKVLAEAVFGSEQAMIRVDMSEYMEKYSVSRFIGSPPGYVGYDEGGQLSEQVRRHPYSVLLFDEIEKAHPDVFNILLQVLDEGHITDSHGRRVDFKNTCIIMSSNAGAQRVMEPKHLGFGAGSTEEKQYEAMKSGVMEEVRRIFRPEFLNRIDDIIVFHPLTKEEVGQIAALQCRELTARALSQMEIALHFTPSAMKLISEEGYSEKYGARPIRRYLQDKVEDALSEKILAGEISRGDTVQIRAGKDRKLIFTVKKN